MRVAVVGAAGNFGGKRLRALARDPETDIVALCDVREQAIPLPAGRAPRTTPDHRSLLDADDVDAVVVSLPDALKVGAVAEFLEAGKHVLAEKPLTLAADEASRLFSLARTNGVALYVGYNLRFFPSVATLLDLVARESLGPIHSARLTYGHGGAHGLARGDNWRVGPESWGGAFVDMGTHLLSIASELMPSFDGGCLERQSVVAGSVDDGCAAVLRGGSCLVSLTSSWTTWRSRFAAEVYGSEGFAELEGLVKYVKYGQGGERIRHGRRRPEGPPEETVLRWDLDGSRGTAVDPLSAELEYLDVEWRWFREGVEDGSYDDDAERRRNVFVAEVSERLYA